MENAHIERKDMQYLYNDGDLYYFMDTETYEQLPINKATIGDTFKSSGKHDRQDPFAQG